MPDFFPTLSASSEQMSALGFTSSFPTDANVIYDIPSTCATYVNYNEDEAFIVNFGSNF